MPGGDSCLWGRGRKQSASSNSPANCRENPDAQLAVRDVRADPPQLFGRYDTNHGRPCDLTPVRKDVEWAPDPTILRRCPADVRFHACWLMAVGAVAEYHMGDAAVSSVPITSDAGGGAVGRGGTTPLPRPAKDEQLRGCENRRPGGRSERASALRNGRLAA